MASTVASGQHHARFQFLASANHICAVPFLIADFQGRSFAAKDGHAQFGLVMEADVAHEMVRTLLLPE